MTKQITNKIFMIAPVRFFKNEETAENNHYQQSTDLSRDEIQKLAHEEFYGLVGKIKEENIEVTIFKDTNSTHTPDAIFPNNWISTHEDGNIKLYPMYALNRRKERRKDITDYLTNTFRVSNLADYTIWEEQNKFMEGTGSMVFDRVNKKIYACFSDRTMKDPLLQLCKDIGYTLILFSAFQTVKDGERKSIYHTNVMMSVGEKYAVVCLDSIDDPDEKRVLEQSLRADGKEIIDISEDQTQHFAGNTLQLRTNDDRNIIVMSSSAFDSLEKSQINVLSNHGKIVYHDISTIEKLGGGGVRCMIAENFLPYK